MKSNLIPSKFLFLSFIFCGLLCSIVKGQQPKDTLTVVDLDAVVVKAFEQNKRLRDVPAAINYIGSQNLGRFSSNSILQAVNTTPGVRMEERSPGSYRLNIRGSSLRSPFGVRNVKVYYNDLPFTNPGGQTYLNSFGFYNFSSIEVIKGPGSSLYGAGTGGVLLINGISNIDKPGVEAEYTTGFYGHHNVYGSIVSGTEKFRSKASYQHQEVKGYRSQSALKRDVISWTGDLAWDEDRSLKATFLFSDLEYQTPGALTATEFEKNPKASRPASAVFPSAVEAKAAIYQKTALAGVSYSQKVFSKLESKTSFYGSFTQLLNPNVQAYERSSLPHFGGRTIFTFSQPLKQNLLVLNAGTEWQQGYTNVSIHKNVNGSADTIRTYDEISNRQSMIFAQASLDISSWTFMAGASYNIFKIRFQRFIPRPLSEQSRTFNNNLVPRLAILKKWKDLTIYSSLSRGFSPPTTEELLPTGGDINLALNAEKGTNYDLGLRTTVRKFSIDINAFIFSLQNSIVTRRTAGGGSFFTNAGSTAQKGLETSITYPLFQSASIVERGMFWVSHTYHHFKYNDFIKDTINFSGKNLPGVAPHTLSAGVDVATKSGISITLNYFYSDKIPLNDANSVYANSYHLLGLKIGYQKTFNGVQVKIFGGAENVLDEKYSLGNDINGFGGRYFNAAATRNYFAGVNFKWNKKTNN